MSRRVSGWRALAVMALAVMGAGCAGGVSGALRPGAAFKDCPDCPQMVVIPPGRFTMGSPGSEPMRDADEGPQREVTIPSAFAVSTFEVTRGQFAQFVQETNHPPTKNCSVWTGVGPRSERVAEKDWKDPNYPQTDDHPVACISWNDAQAFIGWLSAKAGKPYRMLSEAEWEYAALAGATGRFSFGENPDELCAHGNVPDIAAREAGGAPNWIYANCKDGFALATAPVGSFKANAFGLHDMHGNVWEWVQDCYQPNYEGAPVDGSAREAPNCPMRIDRGGGFFNNRGTNRAADRALYPPANNSANIGLRVARALP